MSVACRHVRFSVPLVEQAVDTARGLFEDLVGDGIDEVRRRKGKEKWGGGMGNCHFRMRKGSLVMKLSFIISPL